MPRVPTVSIEEAGGKVKEIYADIARVQGETSWVFQCFANDPEVLDVEWQMDKVLMRGESALSSKLRQYISLTTSILHGCGG